MSFGVHLSTTKLYSGARPLFQLRLTEPDQNGSRSRDIFSQESDALASFSLKFPDPGGSESGLAEFKERVLGTAPYPQSVALWGRLSFSTDEKYADFSISRVGIDDSILLFALRENKFFAIMSHQTKGLNQKECVVTCADGKTAQPCVTCKTGDVEIRICC